MVAELLPEDGQGLFLLDDGDLGDGEMLALGLGEFGELADFAFFSLGESAGSLGFLASSGRLGNFDYLEFFINLFYYLRLTFNLLNFSDDWLNYLNWFKMFDNMLFNGLDVFDDYFACLGVDDS